MIGRPPSPTPFPYPTLSRSQGLVGGVILEGGVHGDDLGGEEDGGAAGGGEVRGVAHQAVGQVQQRGGQPALRQPQDRKSTRLNSSHANISYAVFCLKKKKTS